MRGEEKITAAHRARSAIVYIRQSTLVQVRDNTESTLRQYDLAARAVDLGWAPADIVVVDADLGVSGGFGLARDGFKEIVSRICMGGVGAVFGLEVSRLARSSAEFARLLELARLTDTLVIDAEGVYDLMDVNDRLLLGLKGTLSEAEVHLIVSRMHGAKLAAARRGDLKLPLPIGYLYDEDRTIVFDPDEQVRAAVTDVFAAFTATGSAFGAVAAFVGRGFPYRVYGGAFSGQLRFRPLIHARVLQILKNPVYAGAFVYGRRRTVHRVAPDGTVKIGWRTAERSEWHALVLDHHPGYITWAQFLDIEAKLAANNTRNRGRPPREGWPLAQGIIVCGACGGKMSTRYRPQGDTRSVSYECSTRRKDHAQAPGCAGISSRSVDPVIETRFLQAADPEQVALAIAAAEQVADRHARGHKAAEMAVARARYEADRAERAFGQVEPENRLVARTLEDRWEAKLAALTDAELALAAAVAKDRPLPDPATLAGLAKDLTKLWNKASTTHRDRKRLIRTLLADVTVMPGDDLEHAVLGLRWHTGATETHTVRRLWPGRTAPETLEIIRAAAPTTNDRDLAQQLNALGLRTARGNEWDAKRLLNTRWNNGILAPRSQPFCPGETGIPQIIRILGISFDTVRHWIDIGALDAHKTAGKRWHVTWNDEVEARCRDLIAASPHVPPAARRAQGRRAV